MSQAGILNVSGGGGGGSPIETITGNDLTPESPFANNFNFRTSNTTVKFKGTASTETLDFGLTNLALGSSMPAITTAYSNCFFGLNAGDAVTTASDCVGIGFQTLQNAQSVGDCVAIGARAMQNSALLNANSDVAIGSFSMQAAIDSNDTVAIGYSSLQNCPHGGSNTCIGYETGFSYVGAESFNILIGNSVTGTANESNVTRIGNNQSKCFVAGIVGNTVPNAQFVTVDSTTGQLGVTSSSIGFAWNTVTSASPTNPIQILVENGYICAGASLVTFLLPLAPSVGDTFKIFSFTSRFQIIPNGGQQIVIGTVTGLSGATGTATSNSSGDEITITYMGGNVFQSEAPQGTITVVYA